MQIMLVFEIQIFVHQIQPVDFWFNISYSVDLLHSIQRYTSSNVYQNALNADLLWGVTLLLYHGKIILL